jgi:S1-C subfamily serine protease
MDVVEPVPSTPPSPTPAPLTPAPLTPSFSGSRSRQFALGNRRGLLAVGSLLVLSVVAGMIFGVTQMDRLTTTRHQLTTLLASEAAQQAQVSTLTTTVNAQANTLATLDTELRSAQAQLTTTESRLGTTQTQLQTAQTRLGADEQQLSVTTRQLPPDLVALATQVSPSVVLITCTTAAGGDTGTGFAVSLQPARGYATTIITAEHVIDACTDPASGAFISLARGGKTLQVNLRGYDPGEDVAILDTTATLPKLKPSVAPVVGEFLMAVGNPLGVNDNVTSGNVSQVYTTYFLDSAPISNGSSGGPVVDRSGNVVGIVDAGAVADANTPVVQNLNVALRLSRLCVSLLAGSDCAALH